MCRIEGVKPLPDYRVWIRFHDGTEGTVDLSDLKGKGVFARWNDINFFNSIYIDYETKTLTWPGEIDIDPIVLYAEVKGIQVDELLKMSESYN